MKLTEDKQSTIMLENVKGGDFFLYYEATSASTQAAVMVRWSVDGRSVVCIDLASGDFMKFDRANHVTPITLTELKYTV